MGDRMTASASYPFVQRASFGELAGLAGRNALYGLLTLTLFRFWARTSMRRRLWARTEVMDDPLEYTGSGMELVRGFIVSLPTFFLPAIFAINIAPLAFEPGTAALLAFGFYVAAVPLIAAGRYWMRRYQLSRTRWRGIRFALDGSGWAFALASSGWTILQIVTLGWYTPAARMRRAKLMWENTRFGDQPLTFAEGEEKLAKGLYGPFALGWFGMFIGYFTGAIVGLLVVLVIALLLAMIGVISFTAPPAQDSPFYVVAAAAAIILVVAFAIATAALAWVPYIAASMRRIASMIRLDGARFELNVTIGGLAGVSIVSALIFIFSIGLLAPLSGAIYMRHLLNHLTLVGQPKFAEIGQPAVAAPDSGEGMADAFDLDFGIGIV